MISIGAVWKKAWRRVGAALVRYFEPVPPPGPISEAIAEAIVRFPNDRVVREAGAWAELEVREILGQRRFDA